MTWVQQSQDSTSGDLGLSKCEENPNENIVSPCFSYELVGFSFYCPISDPCCVLAEPDTQNAGLEGQSIGLLPAVVSSGADYILVIVWEADVCHMSWVTKITFMLGLWGKNGSSWVPFISSNKVKLQIHPLPCSQKALQLCLDQELRCKEPAVAWQSPS